MTALRLVLGDQLTRGIAALRDYADGDIVLMAEVADETTYVKHHKQKIAFIFSAMRHFAEELRADGLRVDYIKLDDRDNTGSIRGEVQRAVKRHGLDRIITTFPGEWRVLCDLKSLADFGIEPEIREDDRFFATTKRFSDWAADRKSLRMEFFYREMRRETDLLMQVTSRQAGNGITTAKIASGCRSRCNCRSVSGLRPMPSRWRCSTSYGGNSPIISVT